MGELYVYTKRGSAHEGHACKLNRKSKGWYDGKLLARCCDCGSYFIGPRESFKKLNTCSVKAAHEDQRPDCTD